MSNKDDNGKEEDKDKKGKEDSSLSIIEKDSYETAKRQVKQYTGTIEDESKDFLKIRKSELFKSTLNDTSPFSEVKRSTNSIIEKLINHYSKDIFDEIKGIKGKEEDISASFSERITDSLIGEFKSHFDGKKIGDYKFNIRTQSKQKQEPYTGADMFGLCTVNHGYKTINKYFLMQAKVGERRTDGSFVARDSRILKQAEKMLNISSSSFFVLYTTKGFEIVSAMNVWAFGKNVIDTRVFKSVSYEEFNNSVLDCFTGDMRFDKPEWRSYIIDPENTSVPFEESLLHIVVNKSQEKKKKKNRKGRK